MERGVYFDAWFPRQHCYHPSLPPRRLRMIDDLVDYRATMLVWSALGGGSVSLPYLEQEAFGTIDERFRFYGFVNDSEFIAHCRERGIKVFGIVFEAQGWELPAEIDGGRVVAVNELRGAGERTTIGLRAFSRDAGAFGRHFPGGLRNSDGETVTDLWDECCSRALDGTPLRARWVEAPDREHVCRYMDTNNPVWREYLKAIVRIQVDAGVAGIQFDETSTPLGTFQYGGCFCRDCMKGFAAHLGREGFDYAGLLRSRGFDGLSVDAPLFWDYVDFQIAAAKDAFVELVTYAREYGRSVGREVLVCGNFFNVFPYYDALIPHVDMLVTEMRNQLHRQPAWFRYVAGAAGDKDVLVVENPYGGVVPELVAELAEGRGRDRLRLSLYEAAAMGVNMTVPYGSWMGATIEDSFWAPHELLVEVQDFLASVEHLSPRATAHEVAVLFSIASNLRGVIERDSFGDFRDNESQTVSIPFWDAADGLAEAGVPIDVIVLRDGVLREDELTTAELSRYRAVVAAGCDELTDGQRAALAAYEGVVVDSPAELPGSPQVRLPEGADVATTVRDLGDGFAVHLVNYAHANGAVVPLDAFELRVRLPRAASAATLHRPGREPLGVPVTDDGEYALIVVDPLETYAVVELR